MLGKIVSREDLNNKLNVDDFIDNSFNGTVFGTNWFTKLKNVNDFIIIEDNDEIVLIMPLFCKDKSKILNQSTMYIPYGGPIIKNVPNEERNKIRYLRDLNNILIALLKEKFDYISFSIDPMINDIMPYIRKGFMPEIRYTYKLNITNSDTLYLNYGHDRRKEIRKANKNNLEFRLDKDLKFTNINKYVEWESKYGFDSSADEVKSILTEAIKNNNGMSFVAIKDNITIGSVGMLWRNKTAYIMYSYFDKSYDLGTISFLYDNIFRYLSKNRNIKIIDFEGSVYESVENWNISFGAFQDRFYNLHYNIKGNDEIARTMYAYFEK